MNQHFLERKQLPLIINTWKMPWECLHNHNRKNHERDVAEKLPPIAQTWDYMKQRDALGSLYILENARWSRGTEDWKTERRNQSSANIAERRLLKLGLDLGGELMEGAL